MQIGSPDLDRVCHDVIVPALNACGLEPKRIDKHNERQLRTISARPVQQFQ